jgi:hypothetical protein
MRSSFENLFSLEKEGYARGRHFGHICLLCSRHGFNAVNDMATLLLSPARQNSVLAADLYE